MTFVEFLIITGPSVGFVIGTWWSRNKIGGTVALREQRDHARRELQQRRMAGRRPVIQRLAWVPPMIETSEPWAAPLRLIHEGDRA